MHLKGRGKGGTGKGTSKEKGWNMNKTHREETGEKTDGKGIGKRRTALFLELRKRKRENGQVNSWE
jgi:hypothetical protein